MDKRTYNPTLSTLKQDWHLVDVNGKVLGKVASEIAVLLMGKNKATFTPGVVSNDKVVVTNAAKVVVTGRKETDKVYYRHSNYPGGLKSATVAEVREKDSRRLIEYAVKGMLPNTKLRKNYMANLFVYAEEEHPHKAQLGGSN
jgi:large subunit ribosomal protein L13